MRLKQTYRKSAELKLTLLTLDGICMSIESTVIIIVSKTSNSKDPQSKTIKVEKKSVNIA